MRKILILGCGWVGEDLAVKLVGEGFEVWATTTQVEKANRLKLLGMQAVVADFDSGRISTAIPSKFDFILTSVPASSKMDTDQTHSRFGHVQSFLKNMQFKRHIYLSSIGIYPNIDAFFNEDYNQDLNERLLAAEEYMLTCDQTAVYRLGGLFGKNRILAKYVEHKVCTTGEQLANFIHVDDVVELIYKGLEQGLKSTVYNIVAPEHPKKKDVIIASAEKYNFQLPAAWEPKDSFQKIVDGSKIRKELNYSYKYPNPIDF